MASPPASLLRHRAELEAALKAAVGTDPGGLAASARYAMGWEDRDGRPTAAGGKRIRPSLCLMAAEAVGGTAMDALPGAVAVELIHNFSLVHDDIQDRDRERHGRPTLWSFIGEGQAINVGDFLYTLAITALAGSAAPAQQRLAALAVLNRAIASMIGGQWDDLSFEDRGEVTPDDYLAMVAGKTAAMLAAPLEIGAILAGAPDEVSTPLGRWGLQVGLAFQVQDDVLGIWGDSALTGKSNTSDIARRKKTLPIIHGLAHPAAGGAIREAYAGATPDVAAVVGALEAAGSDAYCRERAAEFVAAAAVELERVALPASMKDELRAVGEYLISREA
ncbi:MAG: polyprenyl synthetase family protein [Chloroflexi bacterium]|nr:polyprenyl synthetase family protein [Chloroflexota bacterium]